jgi:hypothetical protein
VHLVFGMILSQLEFSPQISLKISSVKYLKSWSRGIRVVHADGWTDGHDKDDINFLKDNGPNCQLWFIGAAAVGCETMCLLSRLCSVLFSDS